MSESGFTPVMDMDVLVGMGLTVSGVFAMYAVWEIKAPRLSPPKQK
jgi:hypothetical protein